MTTDSEDLLAADVWEDWAGEPRSGGALRKRREQLVWPDKEFRLLSIDGGGIKGIFAAAVAAKLEEVTGTALSKSFDMIVGTSTGGIVALALSVGIPAKDILDLYREKGGTIFPRKRSFGVIGPAYRQSPLADALKTTFGGRILGDATTRLCIPSADGTHGDVAVLKTPHHPDFARDWKLPMKEVALATSAAPTFLQVHSSGGYQFIDGGVWANNPIMVGLADALSCFKLNPRQIKALSIGNGSRKPVLGWGPTRLGGAIGWMFRGALIESMLHYAAMGADGQAGLLIGRDQLLRIEPQGAAAGLHMTDHKAASKLLPDAANEAVDRYWDSLAPLTPSSRPFATFYYGPRAGQSIKD